ncbi:MAG: hypothetical protein FWF80_07475 [Defluviitaleaceae bacterium]|nr:hypothetical protein [Defluviitaleaceae bacterium]
MQAQAYEGYFESGKFYTADKPLHIPERKRIFITIPGDVQNETEKQIAWNEFKLMINDTEHENALLDDDTFSRRDSCWRLPKTLN